MTTTPPPLDPQIQATLDQAQIKLSQGRPKQAAALFAQAAQQLEAANPQRAANVHAQAAHAYADRKDEANCLTEARTALNQFKAQQLNDRVVQFYNNISHKLQRHSLNGALNTLQKEFGKAVAGATTLTAAQLNAITQANKLLAANHPIRAGAGLAEVAGEIEGQFPQRAANLYAGAAHAYADGSNDTQSVKQARSALNLFLKNDMGDRASTFYTNLTQKLRGKGLGAAADLLQQEFGSKITTTAPAPTDPAASTPTPTQAAAATSAAPAPVVRGRLPSSCPTCGGPARSDEVEWIDTQSAACIYCGAVLQAV